MADRRDRRDRRDYREHDNRDNRDNRDRREFKRRSSGGSGGKGSLRWSNDKEKEREPSETERIGELIVLIGDKQGSPIERNLQGLSNALLGELGRHRTTIFDFIFKCVLNLPPKIPIYATLVGLLNASDNSVGSDVVYRVNDELQVALRHNEFFNIQYLVRFACDLVNANVVQVATIFPLFDKLLPEDDIAPLGRSDFFTLVVMDTLPFVGSAIAKADQAKFQELMNKIDKKTKERDLGANRAVNIFWNSPVQPSIRNFYEALVEHAAAGWPQICIITPHVQLTEQLSRSKPHPFSLQGIELPVLIPSESRTFFYPPPKNTFRLFEGDNNPLWVNRQLSKIDRYLLEEAVRGILHVNHPHPKECVRLIQVIPSTVYFDKMVDIAIEVLFSELFSLPFSPIRVSRVLFLGHLISELCKQSRQDLVVPGALAQAVQKLYSRVDTLDCECYYLFVEWFAHHLSNCEYKWVWSQFINPTKPKEIRFIKDSLERCVRLSYYERIERVIPKELISFLPDKPRPNFKYLDGPSVEGYRPAQMLVNLLQKKEPSDKIISWLDTDDTVKDISQNQKIDIVLTCLLGTTSKSFSHLLISIDRYIAVLQKLIHDAPSAIQAITSVETFWKYSTQRIIITMSKFITFRLIPPPAIVEWLFYVSSSTSSTTSAFALPKNFHENLWIFELLIMAADQTVTSIALLQKKLNDMEANESSKEDPQLYKRTEDNLLAALQEQREFFLRIFQRFDILLKNLSENLEQKKREKENNSNNNQKPETQQEGQKEGQQEGQKEGQKQGLRDELEDAQSNYDAALGLFHFIGRKYHRELRPLSDMLDLLLSSNTPSIASVYSQFKSLLVNYY